MPRIDMVALELAYRTDRQAVRKCADRYGITVQSVYEQMDRAGIKRRRGGDANKGTQARENNPNWKNGTTRRKDGYILEYRNGKQFFQHRLVAEKMLVRSLKDGECIHHRNGKRDDNRPENIEVCTSNGEHMKYHCPSDVMRERGKKGLDSRYAALRARG